MRNRIKLGALAGFAALMVGALFGFNNQMVVDAAPKSNIATVYKEQCAKCHGAEGKGLPGLGTPNFADAKWQSRKKDKEIYDIIAKGSGIMPGYSETLSKTQINGLVRHIRAFAKSGKSK